jgi:hypothetical protein
VQVGAIVAVILVIVATCVWPSDGLASDGWHAVAGVRSTDARIVAAVQDGLDSSEKFRSLVRQIEQFDGIVMVEEGKCPRRVRACLLVRVTKAAAFRVLFVHIDLPKTGSDLVPLLGHELMHAVEVLRERGVDTAAEMHHLFDSIGVWSGGRMSFETRSAIEAGDRVRADLQKARARPADAAEEALVWVLETDGRTYMSMMRR